MNSKALWTLIAFLIWSAGSTYWYVCKIKGFCPSQQTVKTEVTEPAAPETATQGEPAETVETEQLPWLYFPLNATQPVIGDTVAWEQFIKELTATVPENKKLKITGYYYAEETGGGEALGKARAEAVKKLLAGYVAEGKILVEAEALPGNAPAKGRVIFDEKNFAWVNDNAFVQEKRDKIIIFFPFASDKAITTPEILNYLDELAAQMKQNPQMKVELTGYTDNVGRAESNKWWGLKRAESIALLLRQRGIPEDRIIVKSGGEENPIADNATPEGRRKNRRVEVKVINP